MKKPGVVKVEQATHRRIRLASAATGRSITVIVEEALTQWLEKNREKVAKEVASAN